MSLKISIQPWNCHYNHGYKPTTSKSVYLIMLVCLSIYLFIYIRSFLLWEDHSIRFSSLSKILSVQYSIFNDKPFVVQSLLILHN